MNDKSIYESNIKPVITKKFEKDIQLFLVKKTVTKTNDEPTAAQVALKASKLIKDIVESDEKNLFSLINILNNHNKFYGG